MDMELVQAAAKGIRDYLSSTRGASKYGAGGSVRIRDDAKGDPVIHVVNTVDATITRFHLSVLS
jgi:hypothetical protein